MSRHTSIVPGLSLPSFHRENLQCCLLCQRCNSAKKKASPYILKIAVLVLSETARQYREKGALRIRVYSSSTHTHTSVLKQEYLEWDGMLDSRFGSFLYSKYISTSRSKIHAPHKCTTINPEDTLKSEMKLSQRHLISNPVKNYVLITMCVFLSKAIYYYKAFNKTSKIAWPHRHIFGQNKCKCHI